LSLKSAGHIDVVMAIKSVPGWQREIGANGAVVPLFVRLSDLAGEAGVHPHAIERYLFRGVISADAQIRHGRSMQPIFLQNRVGEHLKAIRKYLESLETETASR
jgi:hypothetical protein